MRSACAAIILLLPAADAPARRFGVEVELKTYPQSTPKEALASVLKAIETKHADYIVAQLADPEFVDRRVKETSYDDLVAEATGKLINDPGAARQLRALLDKGTWGKVEGDTQSASLGEASDRIVSFRKAEGRWFLKQPYRKPVPKPERE
jgi:hypothetical protein